MRSTERSPRQSKPNPAHTPDQNPSHDALTLARILELLALIAPAKGTAQTSPPLDQWTLTQTASELRTFATSNHDSGPPRESIARAIALIEASWATVPSGISTPARATPIGPLGRLLALIKPGAGSARDQVIHPLSPKEREKALRKLRALGARLDVRQPLTPPGPSPDTRAAKDRPRVTV